MVNQILILYRGDAMIFTQYRLEIRYKGELVYRIGLNLFPSESIDEIKNKYKKIIAYSRMLNENELTALMIKC